MEEVTCFSGSNKGSNSEVQSLSSYQSDSGDDNGKSFFILLVIAMCFELYLLGVLVTDVPEDFFMVGDL